MKLPPISSISKRIYVPLVSAEEIEHRSKKINEKEFYYKPIYEHLWREIRINLYLEEILINLGNVNEEAAKGGYVNNWSDCKTLRCTWKQFCNLGYVYAFFEGEKPIVFDKFREMYLPIIDDIKMYRKHIVR
jgi:hypothetical protein